MRTLSALALCLFAATCLAAGPEPSDSSANPWPRIRQERVRQLLPSAMKEAGVDAWLVVCRENANDPLAVHVGGENAGGEAAFLFFREGNQVHSVAISPAGEATALRDVGLHDAVEVLPRGAKVWPVVAAALRARHPGRVAVNSSARAMADGLSHTQRVELECELGPEWAERLVSSEELVVQWLSVKLPEEVEIMRRAAAVTDGLLREACRTIVPGKTADADVARFLKGRMRELGVEDAWAPDQNPNVNSGPDRGHSNATDRVIVPGDVIQMDFGIKVHGIWCSDVQRFAYVLREGESAAPEAVRQRFEKAVRGHRLVLAALRPGASGYEVDMVQRRWMKEQGSLPVMWGTGHPVGYWAHDLGPALSGGQTDKPPSGDATRRLKPGMVFAWDGFFSWEMDDAGSPVTADTAPAGESPVMVGPNGKPTKTISVEEMAVVTETGSQLLSPPQESLILIGKPGK